MAGPAPVQGGVTRMAETAETPAQRVLCNEARPLEVWGVVTTVIRQLLT